MRVVYDTNVVISGLIWSGLPGEALRAAADGRVGAVASEALVDELRAVLARSKFEKYLKRRSTTPEELVSHYLSFTQIVEPHHLPPNLVRDLKDVMVLEAAVGGKVACVITGDDDLLTLKSHADIRILTVADFLDLLSSEDANGEE
jgi:putative PIN family toxin of toxin-antitoxin system